MINLITHIKVAQPFSVPYDFRHSPYVVQHRSVLVHVDQPIGHGDVVQFAVLAVHEVKVRHPDVIQEARVQLNDASGN